MSNWKNSIFYCFFIGDASLWLSGTPPVRLAPLAPVSGDLGKRHKPLVYPGENTNGLPLCGRQNFLKFHAHQTILVDRRNRKTVIKYNLLSQAPFEMCRIGCNFITICCRQRYAQFFWRWQSGKLFLCTPDGVCPLRRSTETGIEAYAASVWRCNKIGSCAWRKWQNAANCNRKFPLRHMLMAYVCANKIGLPLCRTQNLFNSHALHTIMRGLTRQIVIKHTLCAVCLWHIVM